MLSAEVNDSDKKLTAAELDGQDVDGFIRR